MCYTRPINSREDAHMANICILISIVFYLLFMVGVGLWYTRRNTSADDFYLGGRKLGPYVTAMSAEAFR